jgi:hypothetical protein
MHVKRESKEVQMVQPESEISRGTYSVALCRTEEGEFEAQCLEMERVVKRARTEAEVLAGIGQMIGIMLDERREAARQAGKTLLEMRVDVSSLDAGGMTSPK